MTGEVFSFFQGKQSKTHKNDVGSRNRFRNVRSDRKANFTCGIIAAHEYVYSSVLGCRNGDRKRLSLG